MNENVIGKISNQIQQTWRINNNRPNKPIIRCIDIASARIVIHSSVVVSFFFVRKFLAFVVQFFSFFPVDYGTLEQLIFFEKSKKSVWKSLSDEKLNERKRLVKLFYLTFQSDFSLSEFKYCDIKEK